jgi:hypothetical protein
MASCIKSDLEFNLERILIVVQHAAGEDLLTLIPNTKLAFSLRIVDGSFNNIIPGRADFGAADLAFPRMPAAVFRQATRPVPRTSRPAAR